MRRCSFSDAAGSKAPSRVASGVVVLGFLCHFLVFDLPALRTSCKVLCVLSATSYVESIDATFRIANLHLLSNAIFAFRRHGDGEYEQVSLHDRDSSNVYRLQRDERNVRGSRSIHRRHRSNADWGPRTSLPASSRRSSSD